MGVSFAIEDGPAHYLPVRHEGGGNLDSDQVWSYLRKQSQEYTGDIVGANLSYDMDYLRTQNVPFDRCRFRDIQIAEPLLDEHQDRYSLQAIAERYEIPGKSEEGLNAAAAEWGLDPKAELWKLPAKYVAEYAIQDVVLPLKIIRRQERRLEDEDLWNIYNLESSLLPVLVKMTGRGVRFSHDRLYEVEKWCLEEEIRLLDNVSVMTGIKIPYQKINNATLVAKVIESTGITLPKTPSGLPSIKREVLESLAADNQVVTLIVKARSIDKIRNTFVNSIRNHAIGDRIHCGYNQLRGEGTRGFLVGPAYGRISSRNPNLQQQPIRHPDLGHQWRSIFIADEGLQWACLDYSQQEPRMTIHYAVKCKCTMSQQAADAYRNNPDNDNHQMMADMAKIKRDEAKAIFLGLCYGMGGAKLCRNLGLKTEWINRNEKMVEVAGPEGRELLQKFHDKVPFLHELNYRAQAQAQRHGKVTTFLGRICRFQKDEQGRYDFTYRALNRVIQGSSADQTKLAMVKADESGFPLHLQVHDELNLCVHPDYVHEIKELVHIMENCIKLEVPSKVDCGLGEDWGDAK